MDVKEAIGPAAPRSLSPFLGGRMIVYSGAIAAGFEARN
jgi:hypothetical protein